MDDLNLNKWRDYCGVAAASNGWHDDYHRAVEARRLLGPNFEQAVIDHVAAKTALIGCEVAEAIEEIRLGGVEWASTYYTDSNGNPADTGKPEGFPSELADVIIRALDLAYMLNIDIHTAVKEKLAYNETRGTKHGGKAL